MSQDLKYQFVEIDNFMGVPYAKISFDGRSAYFIGPNGSGKSSTITALRSPLDSSFIPSEPVNNRSESGSGMIRLRIGPDDNPTMYEIGAFYDPKNRTGKLTLHENGVEMKKGVKTELMRIMGKISFDMYEFLNMPISKKIETLKALTGRAEEITAIEQKIADKKSAHDYLEKYVTEQQVLLKKEHRPFTDEDQVKYEKPHEPSVEAIEKEITGLQPAIDNWNRVSNGIEGSRTKVAMLISGRSKSVVEHDRLQKEIDRLIALIEAEKNKQLIINDAIATEEGMIAKGEAWLIKNKKPDLADINSRLAAARQHDNIHRQINEYAAKHKAMTAKKKERDAAKKDMEELVQQKRDLIADSQLPVEGLYFDDDHVYYNGLPLEDGQINTAQLEDIGIEIACAMKPNLKCVFIQHGSLLDEKTRKRIAKKITDRGLQFIMEIVDDSQEGMVVKFEEKEGE